MVKLMAENLKTIALFNDTSNWPHIGCRAVSDAHNFVLEQIGIEVKYRYFSNEYLSIYDGDLKNSCQNVFASSLLNEISCVDAVLVNGEGTIHHGRGLHLLSIISAAQQIGKPTYLINAVIQEIPTEFFKILAGLRDLTVRDLFSFEYLRENGVRSRLVADSILDARFEDGLDNSFSQKILVTDCVDHPGDTKAELQKVLNYFGDDAIYFPLEGENSANWRIALRKFRSCRMVVTGRHHGLYLALMARVPFVALSSNTWKIEGSLATLNAPQWMYWKKEFFNSVDLCMYSLEKKSEFCDIFAHPFINNRLSTFDLLADNLNNDDLIN